MPGKWIAVPMLAFGLFLLPVPTGGETMDAIHLPVGKLTIAAPRGVEARRSPVTFPHSRHFVYNCRTCHHKWNGIDSVQGCAASGCHDSRTPSEGRDNIRYFKTAYHAGCIPCHRESTVERKRQESSGAILTRQLPPAGPTGCIGCHPRGG